MRSLTLFLFLLTSATANGFQLATESSETKLDNDSKKVETITWTIAWYDRMHGVDGKRTWLRPHPRWERSYMAPGRFRDVRYDKDGSITSVNIEDTVTGKVLHLNMKKKEALLKNNPSGQFGGSPFDGIMKVLDNDPIEFVGQRDVDGVEVNVFRHHREFPHGGEERTEIWLDAESKRLLRYSTTPGDDYFDPITDPDRGNPSEERFSKGTIAGVIHRDIVFDAQLDPSLFSLTPPDGFTIVEPPQRLEITEDMMLDWLELSAQANDGIFIQLGRSLYNMQWSNAIAKKAESERSEAERRYMEIMSWYRDEGVGRPVLEFADVFTEPRSYRYLGKGVKLGNEKQIVCFYKLKSTGKYRAVYGDLRVTDIDPKELPLPVD